MQCGRWPRGRRGKETCGKARENKTEIFEGRRKSVRETETRGREKRERERERMVRERQGYRDKGGHK